MRRGFIIDRRTFLAFLGSLLTGCGGSGPLNDDMGNASGLGSIGNPTATGKFFGTDGANIARFNDRLLLGSATQNPGNAGNSVTGDFSCTVLQGVYAYLQNHATLAVGATPVAYQSTYKGNYGGVFVAQSSDTNSGAGVTTIALSSFVLDNNTGANGSTGWAYYGAIVRTASAASPATMGMEFDFVNFATTTHIDPYTFVASGETIGMQMMAGGEPTTITVGGTAFNPASAAFTIGQNNSNPGIYSTATVCWDKGIVFHNIGISGTDGTTISSPAIAIAMAFGHRLQWYSAAGTSMGSIYAGGVAGPSVDEVFWNQGIHYLKQDDQTDCFRIAPVAGATGFIQVTSSSSAVPIVQGRNTSGTGNVDIQISPQNSGYIQFAGANATYTSAVNTATGYILIKDGAGTVYKVLCHT